VLISRRAAEKAASGAGNVDTAFCWLMPLRLRRSAKLQGMGGCVGILAAGAIGVDDRN
jgi:hypothetical protein